MHIDWRGFELPSAVTCDHKCLTSTYGKFVAEPLNVALVSRLATACRILCPVSKVARFTQYQDPECSARVHHDPWCGRRHDRCGVEHQIDCRKNYSDSTKVIRIEKNKRGPVTGADIIVMIMLKSSTTSCHREFNRHVPFEVEMVVENGRGYIPSTEHSAEVKKSESFR